MQSCLSWTPEGCSFMNSLNTYQLRLVEGCYMKFGAADGRLHFITTQEMLYIACARETGEGIDVVAHLLSCSLLYVRYKC